MWHIVSTLSMPSGLHSKDGAVAADAKRYSFTYDAAGRRTSSIDPLLRRVTSAYDSAGRQKTRLDARGQLSTYTYDADDELLGRKYPNGTRATFAYLCSRQPV